MKPKALFLDRDGVINEDVGYLHKISELKFINGIFELVDYFLSREYKIVIVTNQSGIARGLFSEKNYLDLMGYIFLIFKNKNIPLTASYYCPHYPNATLKKYRKNCLCRKPRPGLILNAQKDYGLDLSKSILVGDKVSDIQSGIAAGVGKNYLFDPLNQMNSEDICYMKVNRLTDIVRLNR